MSCPNNFKVKNLPDEIECVVADKIKANDLAVRGPSNAFLVFANDIVDACSNIPNSSVARDFSGNVLDSDNNQVDSGTVLKTQNGLLIVAL